MDANVVSSLAKATLDGSMPFPQIVGKLIAEGVEYYHVDYATNSFTFYSASGSAVTDSLPFEHKSGTDLFSPLESVFRRQGGRKAG